MTYVWMRDPPDSRDPREEYPGDMSGPHSVPHGYVHRHAIFLNHNCPRCLDGERACVHGNHGRCSWLHARND